MQTLKENIKEKILKEASRIFVKVGYDKATMRDIASKSGISVGNIYRYFKNKDGILEELILDFENELNSFAKNIDSKVFADSSQKMCNKFIDELLEVFKKHNVAINMLSQNIANKRFSKFKVVLVVSVSEKMMMVAKLVKNKSFNKHVARAYATGLLSGIRVIINEYGMQKECKKEIEKDIRTYLKIYLNNLIFRMEEI